MWLVLELCTVLALSQLGIRQSDWWKAGIRSTNLHIVVECSVNNGSYISLSLLLSHINIVLFAKLIGKHDLYFNIHCDGLVTASIAESTLYLL